MLHSIFLSHTLHTIQFQRLAESLIAKSMLGSHMSLMIIICEISINHTFPHPMDLRTHVYLKDTFYEGQTKLLDVEEATDITSLLSDLGQF